MRKKETSFNCRIEELPFLGRYVLISFNRDKDDFKSLSPKYDEAFADKFMAQISIVEHLESPAVVTGHIKTKTAELKSLYVKTRNILNRAEHYVVSAYEGEAGLSLAPADFGFKAVRDEIRAKNSEGVFSSLKFVIENLKANMEVLEPEGYTESFRQEMDNLLQNLFNSRVNQVLKKRERAQLTHKNNEEFMKLWHLITSVLSSGKTIYKEVDKGKLRFYTFTHILKNVRLERKS